MIERFRFVWVRRLLLGVAVTAIGVTAASNTQAHFRKRSLVVVFSGTSQGETRHINGMDMNCFDVKILDPERRRVIGKGMDCLDMGSVMGIEGGDGFTIDNTQIFRLRGGTLVSSLTTTIQAAGKGSPGVTNITGSVPPPGSNQIVYGNRRYRRARARVRLNGDVDMSRFPDENIITFDCIFRIDFH